MEPSIISPLYQRCANVRYCDPWLLLATVHSGDGKNCLSTIVALLELRVKLRAGIPHAALVGLVSMCHFIGCFALLHWPCDVRPQIL